MKQAPGLLAGFFQLGYVVRDVNSAVAWYKRQFGPLDFQVVETPPEKQHPIRANAFTWIREVMIEFIQIDPSQPSIYLDYLPDSGDQIAFHHTGYMVEDQDAALAQAVRLGYEIPMGEALTTADGEDLLDFAYADTRRDMGHFCEFIRLGPAGRAWFSSVPGFVRFPID